MQLYTTQEVNMTTQFSSIGLKHVFWSTKRGNYANGSSAAALSNGQNSAMGKLVGVSGLEVQEPDLPVVNALGNNGLLASFLGEAQEGVAGSVTLTALDQALAAVANGVTTHTEGDYTYIPGVPKCLNLADLFLVVNSPAKSVAPSSAGTSGYHVSEFFAVNLFAKTSPAFTTNEVNEYAGQVVLNRVSTLPTGQTVQSSQYGTTQMAYRAYWSTHPVTYHAFVGNGTTTTVTLAEEPRAASGAAVQVWIDGTAQAYTTNFTVNTTTKVLTFVTPPAAGANVVVRYAFVGGC
jgi:hypothetical protein